MITHKDIMINQCKFTSYFHFPSLKLTHENILSFANFLLVLCTACSAFTVKRKALSEFHSEETTIKNVQIMYS